MKKSPLALNKLLNSNIKSDSVQTFACERSEVLIKSVNPAVKKIATKALETSTTQWSLEEELLKSRCLWVIYLTCTLTPKPLLSGICTEQLKPLTSRQLHQMTRKWIHFQMIYEYLFHWSAEKGLHIAQRNSPWRQRRAKLTKGITLKMLDKKLYFYNWL